MIAYLITVLEVVEIVVTVSTVSIISLYIILYIKYFNIVLTAMLCVKNFIISSSFFI